MAALLGLGLCIFVVGFMAYVIDGWGVLERSIYYLEGVMKDLFRFYMFTIFTAMNWYVYSLSYNGIVFYIGMTSNPVVRYKHHYSLQLRQTSAIISLIRAETGNFIEMDIHYISRSRSKVYECEESIIKMYSNQNIPLFNDKHNAKRNRLKYQWPSILPILPKIDYSIIISDINNKIKKHEQKYRYAKVGNPAIIS